MIRRTLVVPLLLLFCFVATAPCLSETAPPTEEAAAADAGAAEPRAARPTVPSEVELAGRVLLPGDKPASGATVRILAQPGGKDAPGTGGRDRVGKRRDAPKPLVLTTAEDGTFRAKVEPGTRFRLRVDAAGAAPFDREDVEPGADLDLRLERGSALEGTVLDQRGGAPVSGARILACDRTSGPFGEDACRRAESADGGAFKITDLAKAPHRIDVTSKAHALFRVDSVAVPAAIEQDSGAPARLRVFLGPGGRISGRVSDASGKAVSGVSVRTTPADFGGRTLSQTLPEPRTTDENGRFDLVGLPAGVKYTLEVVSEEFAPLERGPFEIEAGTHHDDVELTAMRGATLVLRLEDRDEHPVADFALQLVPEDRHGDRWMGSSGYVEDERIRRGEDGKHTASRLAPGRYTLTVIPERFGEVVREGLRLTDGGTVDLGTLTLEPGRGIGGRITGGDGSPIVGASISVLLRGEERVSYRRVKSGHDGRYDVGGLDEATAIQNVRAGASGFIESDQSNVELGRHDVDFVLDRAAVVKGRVLLPTGEAPGAFRVSFHTEGKPGRRSAGFGGVGATPAVSQAFDDPEGNFSHLGVEPGALTIIATAEGWAPGKQTGLEVAPGATLDIGTIELRAGLTLRGRVVDASTAPVVGAAISVTEAGTTSFLTLRDDVGRVTRSDTDGSFVLEGLEAGSVTATAEHPSYSVLERRVGLREGTEPEDLLLTLTRGGALTGLVLDADGLPAAGARIGLFQGLGGGVPDSATTGPDGRYDFERLAPGSYGVMWIPDTPSFAGMGMKPAVIHEGETTVVNFGDRPRIQLSGRVLRGDEPLADAVLMFVSADGASAMLGGEMKSSKAGPDGAYTVGLDAPGTYRVIIGTGVGGRGRQSAAVLHVPDETEVLRDIVLSSGGLSGSVTDAEGEPLAVAVVSARREGAAPDDITAQASAQTDAAGAYVISGLEPGTYRVSAVAPGYPGTEQGGVEIADGQTTLDLQLEGGRALRGRVVDPEGRPVASALVMVTATGGAEDHWSGSGQTDVNGVFEVLAPQSGGVDLVAIGTGWAPGRLAGAVPPEAPGAPEVVLTLSRGGRIEARVVGRDGQPVAGTAVVVSAADAGAVNALALLLRPPQQPSDAAGLVLLDALAPGTYALAVPGRNDVTRVQVDVREGHATRATISLP